MKFIYLNFVLINLFIFNLCGQDLNNSEADSLRNLGSSFYERNPEKCIILLDRAAIFYENVGNKKQQALCYQNIAFAYFEKLDKVDSAICFIDKAIPIWIEIQDPINLANIFKYLGMLQGKKGEFTKGIESIRQAVALFDKGKIYSGIAVSYFDLASLYESANQLDSSNYYLYKNKEYFESVKDTGRIFRVNNKLFENYIKSGNLTSASEVYDRNLKLEKSNRVYWQQLIDYYRLNMKYFKLLDNEELYNLNTRKYSQLNDSLTNQGIFVK